MHIGINLLYLLPEFVGGTELYATSLLHALENIDTENDYFLFINQESENLRIVESENFHTIYSHVHASNRLKRYFWEQFILPRQLHKYRIDILHSLGYVTPIFTPCANIVTIYDANFFALKKSLPFYKRLFLPIFVKASAYASDHILTASNFSKSQIEQHMSISSEKISVTYAGPRENTFQGLSQSPTFLDQYNIQNPYIIAFSSVTAHKNILRLIDAFHGLSKTFPHTLVLVGNTNIYDNLSIYIEKKQLQSRVILTGYVTDNHILPLLQKAELFVFPSWYEGFGLPILEAQQTGVAIASSTAGSLPEIAGEGALYFDPFSVQDMAMTIQTCLSDVHLRKTLISKGFENLQRFSWENTAKKTLALYTSISDMKKQNSNVTQ